MKFAEECSAIINRQILEKLKDLGSFTIPCVIDELNIEKALCYLLEKDAVFLFDNMCLEAFSKIEGQAYE